MFTNETKNIDKNYTLSLLYNDEIINGLNNSGMFIVGNKNNNSKSHFKNENGNIYIYLEESYLNRIMGNIENIEQEKKEIEKILDTKIVKIDGSNFYKYLVEKNNFGGGLSYLDLNCDNFKLKNNNLTRVSKVNKDNYLTLVTIEIFNSRNQPINYCDISFIKSNSGDIDKLFINDDVEGDYIESSQYISGENLRFCSILILKKI